MNPFKLILILASLLPANLNATGPGEGPHGRPPGPPPPPPPLIHVLEEQATALGLSQDQLEAARAIDAAAQPDLRSIEQDLRSAHDTMRALMDQQNPDLDAVLSQVETIGALQTELHRLRITTDLAIRTLLSEKQWQILQSLRPPRPPKR